VRPGSVLARASRKVYTKHHLNARQPNLLPKAPRGRAEKGAARLVGSATSQLHAVDNAGSGTVDYLIDFYLSALRHTTLACD
jgi:hypothetical protein